MIATSSSSLRRCSISERRRAPEVAVLHDGRHAEVLVDGRDGNLRTLAASLREIEAVCARHAVPVALHDATHERVISPVVPPPLRGYQSAALAAWEVAGRRGVIVLPTGGGGWLRGRRQVSDSDLPRHAQVVRFKKRVAVTEVIQAIERLSERDAAGNPYSGD